MVAPGDGNGQHTQRSWFPRRFIVDPLGSAAPRYVHGPVRSGAVCTAIRPPVEKRKYVPSGRTITAGSWELVQTPVQALGSAEARVMPLPSRRVRRNVTIASSPCSSMLQTGCSLLSFGSPALQHSASSSRIWLHRTSYLIPGGHPARVFSRKQPSLPISLHFSEPNVIILFSYQIHQCIPHFMPRQIRYS